MGTSDDHIKKAFAEESLQASDALENLSRAADKKWGNPDTGHHRNRWC
jgi:hypothetical protein